MNLSQKQLGKKINLSSTSIYKYENGKAEPSIEVLIKLADLFGISVDTLIEHKGEFIDKRKLEDNTKHLIDLVLKLDKDLTDKVIGYIEAKTEKV